MLRQICILYSSSVVGLTDTENNLTDVRGKLTDQRSVRKPGVL
jgi:hypothetical protein